MPFNDYRKESKLIWGRTLLDGQKLSPDDLRLGCMLRIADAIEKIALNYDDLINDRDMYKKWFDEKSRKAERLMRSNAALRGHIKRLKKISGDNK